VSLVQTWLVWLHYGSAMLADLAARQVPVGLLHSRATGQLTQNFDHVTPILQDLHWLCGVCAPQLIEIRLAVLLCRCLHDMASQYLLSELYRVSDVYSRRRLRSTSTDQLLVPLTRDSSMCDRRTAHFRLLAHASGTVCRRT
jgi:hypothetical protein